jgi:hypothetical protein
MSYTVPAVLLVETSAWNNERQCLELGLAVCVSFTLHGESKDTGGVVQLLDEGRVIALGREYFDVKIEIRLVATTAVSGGYYRGRFMGLPDPGRR